jgi:CBS domain-containing protein
MWWPAIGGLVVGLGGLIFPQALGVGYDTIGALLQGDVARNVILGILLVKSVIWAVSLGSGTSGGVLAPLLMMGGALGGIEAIWFPHVGVGFWPLISLGAILGGTMRSPFTGMLFAAELTHDWNVLLPLLIASFVAHGFTVLTLRRSILTEKISRRGLHLSREYSVDPLETTFVKDVMQPAAPDLLQGFESAYPDESLREVVYRMAASGEMLLPVRDRDSTKQLGVISLHDLLQARRKHLHEESERERVLTFLNSDQ